MAKILLITQSFAPRHGGVQNYYFELSKKLPNDNIIVLADKSLLMHGEKPKVDFNLVYKDFFFRTKYIWPKWLRLLFILPGIIHKHKPDILWAGEPLPVGFVVAVMAKLFRKKYILSTHGGDLLNPQHQAPLKRMWKMLLLKFVLNHSSLITANTEYTRLMASKLGQEREKSVVIYPCSTNISESPDISNSYIDTVKELKSQGYTILLGVNRLVEHKGVDMVIKSLPLVWKQCPKVAYVVVSDGPYANTLKKIAYKIDHHIENRKRIIFTGFQSQEETAALYSLSDIYVMVPRKIAGEAEGFGIVYLEAGYFSKPVIGTKMTGIPEAVNELYDGNHEVATGLLVHNPKDEKEIAKKILMLVKDKGLAKKLGQNNKKWIEKFSYQKGAEILLKAVNNL